MVSTEELGDALNQNNRSVKGRKVKVSVRVPSPIEVRHTIIGLHRIATTFEEKGMEAGGKANRQVATMLAELVAEVGRLNDCITRALFIIDSDGRDPGDRTKFSGVGPIATSQIYNLLKGE